jgi:hypothetical protein
MSCCGRQRNIQETYNHMLENDYTMFEPTMYNCPNALQTFSKYQKTDQCNVMCVPFINDCNKESGQSFSYDDCEDICGGRGGPKYDPDAVGPKIFNECKTNISRSAPNCRELIDSCCQSGCQQQAKDADGPNSYEVCVEQCGGESFGYCPDIPQPEPVDPNDKDKKPKKPVPPGGDKKPASKAEQQTFFKTTGGKVTIGVLVALLVLVLVLLFLRMRK